MILLLPTLAVASHLVMASAQPCAPDPTDVRIETKIDQPRIDPTKDSEQLQTMRFSSPVTSDRRFAQLTGLTVGGIAVDSEIRIASDGKEGNPVCAWPTVVTVTLTTSPTIYVLATHGQCQQAVGLKHEMGHVSIDRGIIERYAPIFRQRIAAITEAITADGSPPGRDLRTQRQRIEEKIDAMISVVSDQLNADRSTEQRLFDSPEEYARVSAACPQVTLDPPRPAAGHMRSAAPGA